MHDTLVSGKTGILQKASQIVILDDFAKLLSFSERRIEKTSERNMNIYHPVSL